MQTCAVKMAVAPCLNIKYEYKPRVASVYSDIRCAYVIRLEGGVVAVFGHQAAVCALTTVQGGSWFTSLTHACTHTHVRSFTS